MTLYFLHALHTNLVKVGITTDFDERLRVLRSNCPDEIEVMRVFHGDRESIEAFERELHEELEPVHSHGEWFFPGPETQAALERIDRQFNPENYPAAENSVRLSE